LAVWEASERLPGRRLRACPIGSSNAEQHPLLTWESRAAHERCERAYRHGVQTPCYDNSVLTSAATPTPGGRSRRAIDGPLRTA